MAHAIVVPLCRLQQLKLSFQSKHAQLWLSELQRYCPEHETGGGKAERVVVLLLCAQRTEWWLRELAACYNELKFCLALGDWKEHEMCCMIPSTCCHVSPSTCWMWSAPLLSEEPHWNVLRQNQLRFPGSADERERGVSIHCRGLGLDAL